MSRQAHRGMTAIAVVLGAFLASPRLSAQTPVGDTGSRPAPVQAPAQPPKEPSVPVSKDEPAASSTVTAAKPGDSTTSASTTTKTGKAKASASKSGAKRRTRASRHMVSDDNPAFRGSAIDSLWPVDGPAPLPGSILPAKRIVAFYGNPLSRRMGILGALPPDSMLARLDAEVAEWEKLDPAHPVQPALHLIAVVAQAGPGRDGKYRLRMDSSMIEKVYGWAQSRHALLFLDVQVGHSTLQEELPWLQRFLVRPDVHLGIDPEFSMKDGKTPPGKKIGTYDAADVNYATRFLADLVTKNHLPPKVLVVHRFTRGGVTNYRKIALDPRVQIVMDMDGFGPPWLKLDSYYHYVKKEPVQFTGWKQFTRRRNDDPPTRKEDILRLFPTPLYIQYQ